MNNIISQIKHVTSQKELKQLLDRHFTKPIKSYDVVGGHAKPTVDDIDVVAYNMDVLFDSVYHVGVCREFGSDGQTHDYKDGKWSLSGDNIPTDLANAKDMATRIVKAEDTRELEA